jgi:hypothetical protein
MISRAIEPGGDIDSKFGVPFRADGSMSSTSTESIL